MSVKKAFNSVRLGAVLNEPGLEGETYLTRAVKMGIPKVAKDFLELGADPDAPNAAGEYPLFLALDRKDRRMMAELLKAGASVFYKRDGLTFREAALKAGMTDVAKLAGRIEKDRAAMIKAMGLGVHI